MDEEASELEKLCYVARSVVDTAAEAESDSDDSENGDGTGECAETRCLALHLLARQFLHPLMVQSTLITTCMQTFV